MKNMIKTAIVGVSLLALAACSGDAKIVSTNMTKDAENFKIFRSIKFINGITDKELLTLEGFCNVENNGVRLEALCKDDNGAYLKHFLGLSDNVFYTVEQLTPAQASASHYKFILRPSQIIPNFEIR